MTEVAKKYIGPIAVFIAMLVITAFFWKSVGWSVGTEMAAVIITVAFPLMLLIVVTSYRGWLRGRPAKPLNRSGVSGRGRIALLVVFAALLFLVRAVEAQFPLFTTALAAPLGYLFVLCMGYLRMTTAVEKQLENSARAHSASLALLGLGLLIIHLGGVLSTLDPASYATVNFLWPAVATWMFGIGNYYQKLEPNSVLGIRTPWTVASEHNWYATHRFLARSMVGLGFVALIAWWLNPAQASVVAIGIVAIPPALAILYSYAHHQGQAVRS